MRGRAVVFVAGFPIVWAMAHACSSTPTTNSAPALAAGRDAGGAPNGGEKGEGGADGGDPPTATQGGAAECGPCPEGASPGGLGDGVVCQNYGVCSDNDTLVLSQTWTCVAGEWTFHSFTDDDCCPFDDRSQALGTPCDVGDIRCSENPDDPCGPGLNLACSGDKWILDPLCDGVAGAGGVGAGGTGGEAG